MRRPSLPAGHKPLLARACCAPNRQPPTANRPAGLGPLGRAAAKARLLELSPWPRERHAGGPSTNPRPGSRPGCSARIRSRAQPLPEPGPRRMSRRIFKVPSMCVGQRLPNDVLSIQQVRASRRCNRAALHANKDGTSSRVPLPLASALTKELATGLACVACLTCVQRQ